MAYYESNVSNLSLEAYSGKTILLTGGRGFIGSLLASALASANIKLILLNRFMPDAWKPAQKQANIVMLDGDVTDPQVWDGALSGVDCVFHLASEDYVNRPDADLFRDLNINALAVLHMLETCRTRKYSPHIIFASSANLFGIVDTLPVNEDYPSNPLVTWAAHKLLAENYLKVYSHQYGIRSTTLRLANVYGPTAAHSAFKRVVVNNIITRALAGEHISLYANRNCMRDYVFITDVIDAFLLAGLPSDTRADINSIFVIGSGHGVTIADIWKLIADKATSLINKNVEIKIDDAVKIGAFEMRNFIADSTRFQSVTGWKPKTDLAHGIDLTIQAVATAQSQLQLDSPRR